MPLPEFEPDLDPPKGSRTNLAHHPNPVPLTITGDEHSALVRRVGEMQQTKVEQDEVVAHLHARLNKLGEDLRQKTELVHRLMNQSLLKGPAAGTKSKGLGLSMPNLGRKSKNIATLEDVNKKLQTVLEETLMKNIQLQKMVESFAAGEAGVKSDDEHVTKM